MRRQRLCLLIVFCLLWLCAASAGAAETVPGGAGAANAWPFKDVPEEYIYYKQIFQGVKQGYITPRGEFYYPDSFVTRKEALGSLRIVSDRVVVQTDDFPFDDPELIPESEDGVTAAWASVKNIEQGVQTASNKRFYNGDEKITRGKTVTYMYRASLKDPLMKTLGSVDMDVIKDLDVDRKDSGYDAKAVAWGVQYGFIIPEIVDGKPCFRPDAMCKKGEFSDMMSRYANKRAELKAALEARENQKSKAV